MYMYKCTYTPTYIYHSHECSSCIFNKLWDMNFDLKEDFKNSRR